MPRGRLGECQRFRPVARGFPRRRSKASQNSICLIFATDLWLLHIELGTIMFQSATLLLENKENFKATNKVISIIFCGLND
jgi:hypothetical protein